MLAANRTRSTSKSRLREENRLLRLRTDVGSFELELRHDLTLQMPLGFANDTASLRADTLTIFA